jgi:hypothetical protein
MIILSQEINRDTYAPAHADEPKNTGSLVDTSTKKNRLKYSPPIVQSPCHSARNSQDPEIKGIILPVVERGMQEVTNSDIPARGSNP